MDKKTFTKSPKNRPPQPTKKGYKNFGFIALVILFGLIIFASYGQPSKLKEVPLSSTVQRANNGDIKQIDIKGDTLEITPEGQSQPTEKSTKESGSTIYEQGLKQNIDGLVVNPQPASNTSNIWLAVGTTFIPILIIGAIIFFMLRSAQGQGNQAMSFGKSRARLYGNEKDKVNFTNIAGSDEAKVDLQEIVEFLKFPKKFEAVGAKIPKGVLLVGPPGTGKTMLSRAVAGEADVPFFSISGSEFVEMFVGVGASRVRDLFSKAKKNAPCIIFIDEIDAVGRKRGSGMGGGHDEREQTLNQILVEMDGFEQGTNVIVLAATNRSDVLDPALLRPGRFDRRVMITLPDRRDREAILKVHFGTKPIGPDVDIGSLAAKTAGSSGADLANITNEAAIVAARHNRKQINNADITNAFEKVAIGPERKSRVMSEADKSVTAYHEAGHALVGHVLPDSDPVHKVTIIPRGGTGGVTWFLPPEDKIYVSLIEFKDILARALGGRIAEEIVLGRDHITTGAGNDLQKAAEIARDMIVNQGMGTKLRDQVFHSDEGMMMERLVHEKQYSDDTAKLIDEEVEALITEAATRARAVINHDRKALESLKDLLLEKETVEAAEVLEVFKKTSLPKEAALY